jgi:Golgi nucleoside diphosphatase
MNVYIKDSVGYYRLRPRTLYKAVLIDFLSNPVSSTGWSITTNGVNGRAPANTVDAPSNLVQDTTGATYAIYLKNWPVTTQNTLAAPSGNLVTDYANRGSKFMLRLGS